MCLASWRRTAVRISAFSHRSILPMRGPHHHTWNHVFRGIESLVKERKLRSTDLAAAVAGRVNRTP
jgi:hypothetical protein